MKQINSNHWMHFTMWLPGSSFKKQYERGMDPLHRKFLDTTLVLNDEYYD